MSAVVSDGNYHSVGYNGLDRLIVGGGRSRGRMSEGDRLMHFFGPDKYTETGTYRNLDEDVMVLRYEDIRGIRAFKHIRNGKDELVPGLMVSFRGGVELLVLLEDVSEVQDLARFIRSGMASSKARKHR